MRTPPRWLAPILSTLVLLAACDKQADKKAEADKKADKKADEQPAEAPPVDEVKPVLTLGAAKIMEKDKPDEALEITADGTVKFGPNPDMTLKISTDGKVSKADGTVVAQVGADGSLSFDGKPSGAVVSDSGLTMTGPDGKTGTLKFADDGSVVVDPPTADALQMATEGCTGPMVKTCAVVMTMLLLRGEPAEGGVEAKAVEVAPAVVEAKSSG